jgi:hypothetical protein
MSERKLRVQEPEAMTEETAMATLLMPLLLIS